MANILLLTQGTWGDVYPFAQLGKGLQTKGHDVSLLCHQMHAEKIRQLGLDSSALIFIEPLQEWIANRPQIDIELARLIHMKEEIGWIYKIILRHAEKENPVLVGHYGLHLATQMAVDKTRIPYLPVYISPYFMLNTAINEEHYRNYSGAINGLRATNGLMPVNDWHAWMRLQRRGLGLWPEWFAAPEPEWPEQVELTGFLTSEESHPSRIPVEIRDFIERAPTPPVLVNHGSSTPLRKDYLSICIEGCRQSGLRALVVTQYRQLVEASLGDDVMHYNFAHFPSLMPLMCVIIHHGGIGTTGQAVASGVPQLVMAEMTDGPDNARRLRRIGIAEYLPKLRWTAEFVAEALRHLCASPSVKEKCCHYSKLMADNDPLAVACAAIENFIYGDRHSYQEI